MVAANLTVQTATPTPPPRPVVPPKRETAWTNVSDDVLAVLLQDECQAEFMRAVDELGLSSLDFPKQGFWRQTFKALYVMRHDSKTITPATVHRELNGAVPESWLIERWANANINGELDKTERAAFETNIAHLQGFSQSARLLEVLSEAMAQIRQDPTGRNKVVAELYSDLNNVTDVQQVQHGGLDDLDALLNNDPPPIIRTGISLVDDLLYGIWCEQLVSIVAKYKGGKTRLAMNILARIAFDLRVQNANAPVVIFGSFENTRPAVLTDIGAMLAVDWLRANDHWQKTYEIFGGKQLPIHQLSGMKIMSAGKRYRDFPALQVSAIDAARATLKRGIDDNRLLVYDMTPKGGKLRAITDLLSFIRRAKRLNPDSPVLVAVDHALIASGLPQSAGDYDKLMTSSEMMLQLVKSESVAGLLLAQQNEQTVNSGDSRLWGSGAKGGGSINANSDAVLTLDYQTPDEDGVIDPERFGITLKLSRRSPGGNGTQRYYQMHPSSGLILGDYRK